MSYSAVHVDYVLDFASTTVRDNNGRASRSTVATTVWSARATT
jgi:hypothetical protein